MKIRISAEPEDSKIYVDNQYIGDGTVSYDTGQIGKWGGSKEFLVTIKHPDYITLNTIIENKYDLGNGAAIGSLGLGLGLSFAIQGIEAISINEQLMDNLGALLIMCVGAIGVLDSYKYNTAYYFTLTKNPPSSLTRAP
jgi:hypothetical protein